jgi:hypothetical protein
MSLVSMEVMQGIWLMRGKTCVSNECNEIPVIVIVLLPACRKELLGTVSLIPVEIFSNQGNEIQIKLCVQ